MSIYILLSTGIGVVLFISVCVQVLGGKPQNLASWILFTLLTGIAAASVIAQRGNYPIALVWAIGNGTVSLCIFKSRIFSWTWLESVVVVLVIVCLVIWAMSGAKAATIATSIAFLTAGLPQLRDTYHKPWNTSVVIYFGYSVASTLSVIAGKTWSVEQRLFPMVLVLFNFVVAVVASRKFWLKQA